MDMFGQERWFKYAFTVMVDPEGKLTLQEKEKNTRQSDQYPCTDERGKFRAQLMGKVLDRRIDSSSTERADPM